MHADQRYIDALLQNDQKVVREIYRLYAGQVQRWVLSRGGTVEEAGDVFQDALVALFEKAQKGGFVLTCPLGAMLHVICSRKWVDRLRQKGKDATVRKEEEHRYALETEDDAMTQAEEVLAEQDRNARLRSAFAQLSELCQRLLTLLSNGTKPAEAAVLLEMNSVDTLYRRKNACVERWKQVFFEG